MPEQIIFEYPLSQSYRHFLQLEAAFKRLDFLCIKNNSVEVESALLCLSNLLNFLSRLDIKSEVIKELESQISHYENLKSNPAVDKQKLDNFLQQLQKLHHWAISYRGRLGDDLRDEPLILSSFKKQSLQTGVTACDSPDLYSFLCQPADDTLAQIQQWYQKLEGLKTSINVLLRLTRELSRFHVASAPMGDFLIEKPNPGNILLRVQVSKSLKVFPDVSAGKHRISIHFYTLDNAKQKIKVRSPIDFKYATCGWRE